MEYKIHSKVFYRMVELLIRHENLEENDVNEKQFTYRTQSNKFKSDYFGLCSPLLATKIEDICCTTRLLTDYTGVLLYSNTGSFINAFFSLKSFHPFSVYNWQNYSES